MNIIEIGGQKVTIDSCEHEWKTFVTLRICKKCNKRQRKAWIDET